MLWIFFFKQKTAYEMRISDWSSDVCSSDLRSGAEPSPASQQISASVLVKGQLSTPAEFGAIVLRANPDGPSVRLRDVADIEVGGERHNIHRRLNGPPSDDLGVQISPTGHALADAEAGLKNTAALTPLLPTSTRSQSPNTTAY